MLLQTELALCDCDRWNGNVLRWKFQELGQLVKYIIYEICTRARTRTYDINESLDFRGAASRLFVSLSRNKVVTFSMWENCMTLKCRRNARIMQILSKISIICATKLEKAHAIQPMPRALCRVGELHILPMHVNCTNCANTNKFC